MHPIMLLQYRIKKLSVGEHHFAVGHTEGRKRLLGLGKASRG